MISAEHSSNNAKNIATWRNSCALWHDNALNTVKKKLSRLKLLSGGDRGVRTSRFPYPALPLPVPLSLASRPFPCCFCDLKSRARLTFLQFDSLRDTCALMPLDILWPIWRNHCKRVYYFTGSKPVFQSKRKFSFARLLGSLNSDWEDVKCKSNIIWVDVFESILTHC